MEEAGSLDASQTGIGLFCHPGVDRIKKRRSTDQNWSILLRPCNKQDLLCVFQADLNFPIFTSILMPRQN
jgi:hypothetical protein